MSSEEQKSRAFLVIGAVDRSGGKPVLELADPDRISERFTLWPGLPPTDFAFHPSLASPLFTGLLDGDPVWVESRIPGLTLAQIAPDLTPDRLILILMDVCDILRTLHESGLVHGDLRASNIVVGMDGWVLLTGASLGAGHPEDDLSALIRLGRLAGGAASPVNLPDTVPSDASSLLTDLARQLGLAEPDDLRRGLGAFVRTRLPILVPQALPSLKVLVSDILEGPGAMDEIGLDLGLDADLTGTGEWSGASGEITREATLGETTEGAVGRADANAHRVQILAGLLAPPAQAPSASRFDAAEGRTVQAIADRIAHEPLDPVSLATPGVSPPSSDLPPAVAPVPPASPAPGPPPPRRPWLLVVALGVILVFVILLALRVWA
jgi:hypothetical protein